jgi:hypothetical protein
MFSYDFSTVGVGKTVTITYENKTAIINGFIVDIPHEKYGKLNSMGFPQKVIPPLSEIYNNYYRPKLKLLDDVLYVCSNVGIYMKNLKENSDWELYAFDHIPINDFVKNNNKILAISTGSKNGENNLILLSNDNGKTYIDYTHSHFLEKAGFNYLSHISQNTEGNNSIIVSSDVLGISKSDDFGLSWDILYDYSLGTFGWYLGFHPYDSNTIFYSGENDLFRGVISKSYDGGETWSGWGSSGDNCIHSFTFHPTNNDIIFFSGEGIIGKSIDKGETWNIIDLSSFGMYFFKILFDNENPDILYTTGTISAQNNITVYRSTDMGTNWELEYDRIIETEHGFVFDMVKYKNKLILYTLNHGLLELEL